MLLLRHLLLQLQPVFASKSSNTIQPVLSAVSDNLYQLVLKGYKDREQALQLITVTLELKGFLAGKVFTL